VLDFGMQIEQLTCLVYQIWLPLNGFTVLRFLCVLDYFLVLYVHVCFIIVL